jgi:hypothetical protein
LEKSANKATYFSSFCRLSEVMSDFGSTVATPADKANWCAPAPTKSLKKIPENSHLFPQKYESTESELTLHWRNQPEQLGLCLRQLVLQDCPRKLNRIFNS